MVVGDGIFSERHPSVSGDDEGASGPRKPTRSIGEIWGDDRWGNPFHMLPSAADETDNRPFYWKD